MAEWVEPDGQKFLTRLSHRAPPHGRSRATSTRACSAGGRRRTQGAESVGLRVAHGPAGVRVELTDVVADTAPGQAPREAVGWDASLLDELSDR